MVLVIGGDYENRGSICRLYRVRLNLSIYYDYRIRKFSYLSITHLYLQSHKCVVMWDTSLPLPLFTFSNLKLSVYKKTSFRDPLSERGKSALVTKWLLTSLLGLLKKYLKEYCL